MAEKEYIERGKIENWLLTESASLDTEVDREYVVERLRAEIPTADVRPVVREKLIERNTHLFDLDESGKIDVFAFEFEFHNGPHCRKCGRYICEHCEPDYLTQKCEKPHYECTKCGRLMLEKDNFCPDCGADFREAQDG